MEKIMFSIWIFKEFFLKTLKISPPLPFSSERRETENVLEIGLFLKNFSNFLWFSCVKVFEEKLEVRRAGPAERAEELEVYETAAG